MGFHTGTNTTPSANILGKIVTIDCEGSLGAVRVTPLGDVRGYPWNTPGCICPPNPPKAKNYRQVLPSMMPANTF